MHFCQGPCFLSKRVNSAGAPSKMKHLLHGKRNACKETRGLLLIKTLSFIFARLAAQLVMLMYV